MIQTNKEYQMQLKRFLDRLTPEEKVDFCSALKHPRPPKKYNYGYVMQIATWAQNLAKGSTDPKIRLAGPNLCHEIERVSKKYTARFDYLDVVFLHDMRPDKYRAPRKRGKG